MASPEPLAALSPLATALLSGTAPRPLKLSAARGVLPLSRGEMLRVAVALARDADQEVRTTAAASLAAFPEDELQGLLADPATSPEVLDHFAGNPSASPAVCEAVACNPATSASALTRLAPKLTPAILDLLLLNQTRLIAAPELLDLIGGHPDATPLQRVKVEETRRHFLRKLKAEVLAHPEPPPPPEPAAPVREAPPIAQATEVAEAAEEKLLDNATRRIMRMNTSEKIQLAFKGSREERSILIKDASKTVQEAVLESPKITEHEIESISKMRSVTEDVLRIIATNREWTKNYVVLHSLATNPKTPASFALTFVSRLTARDLKLLAGDKNVPEVIRRQARKVIDARNERGGVRGV